MGFKRLEIITLLDRTDVSFVIYDDDDGDNDDVDAMLVQCPIQLHVVPDFKFLA